MRIAITGTPGTGKTSVSKILSEELGFDYVDLNKLAQERGLVLGKDVKRNSLIIDTKKLGDLILPRNCVIDGHLSHYCAADLVFVLRCDPLELKKRMLVKKWSLSKMRENMEAEALGILAQEARRFHKEVYELDTTGKSTEKIAEEIIGLIRGDRNRYKAHIDYSERVTEIKRILLE